MLISESTLKKTLYNIKMLMTILRQNKMFKTYFLQFPNLTDFFS